MLSELKLPQNNKMYGGDVGISEYTWESAAARDNGSTTVEIPFEHTVLDDTTIETLESVLVTIPDERLGPWYGVQKGFAGHDMETWSLECYQLSILFQNMIVGGEGDINLLNLPAGLIVKKALEIGLSQMPGVPFRLGNFCESTPFVDEYTFSGQSVFDVMLDMMDFTGQEWRIDDDNLIHWGPAVGAAYAATLTEGFDFNLISYAAADDAPIKKVIVVDQNNSVAEATAPEHIMKLTARVIYGNQDVSNNIELQRYADGLLALGRIVPTIYEIELRNQPSNINILFEGGGDSGELSGSSGTDQLFGTSGTGGEELFAGGIVPEPDFTAAFPIDTAAAWRIREGDIVRLISFYAGLQGLAPLCRVISRTYGDDVPLPRLKLISIEPWTEETISAWRDIRNTYAYRSPPTLEQILAEKAWAQGNNKIQAAQIALLSPSKMPSATFTSAGGWSDAAAEADFNNLVGHLRGKQFPA